MSRKDDIERRFEDLLTPIAKEHGVSVYDVEYVKEGSDWYLRGYIDKEGGVDINDCVDVSHGVSDLVDKEDFIEDAYTLEISSPGLGRPLKKDRHLAASIGRQVELKTYKPIDKCKEFAGVLKSFDNDNIVITMNDQELTFLKKDISIIRLALDI